MCKADDDIECVRNKGEREWPDLRKPGTHIKNCLFSRSTSSEVKYLNDRQRTQAA